jgi:hypothetical protein
MIPVLRLGICDAYCGIADVAALRRRVCRVSLIVNVRFVSEEVEASDLEQQQQQQEISMSLHQALPTTNFQAKQATGIPVQQQVFRLQLRRRRALAHRSLPRVLFGIAISDATSVIGLCYDLVQVLEITAGGEKGQEAGDATVGLVLILHSERHSLFFLC